MFRQGRRITDPRAERGRIGVFRRLYHSDDRKIFSIRHQFFHIVLITGFVCPHLILAVILIVVGTVHQLKCGADDVVIGVRTYVLRYSNILLICKLLHHIVEFQRIS